MIVHSIPSLDLPNGFWTELLGRRGKEEMEGREEKGKEEICFKDALNNVSLCVLHSVHHPINATCQSFCPQIIIVYIKCLLYTR